VTAGLAQQRGEDLGLRAGAVDGGETFADLGHPPAAACLATVPASLLQPLLVAVLMPLFARAGAHRVGDGRQSVVVDERLRQIGPELLQPLQSLLVAAAQRLGDLLANPGERALERRADLPIEFLDLFRKGHLGSPRRFCRRTPA
jgi:hypothetical protein